MHGCFEMLALGTSANVVGEMVQMRESTCLKTVVRFAPAVERVFGAEYLIESNVQDRKRLIAIGAARFFQYRFTVSSFHGTALACFSSLAMPQAAQYKIALCQLPEIWSCPYAMQTMRSYAEDIDGGRSPSVSMLSEVAAARKITIVGGSIPEMVPASGQLFNTCCVVGPDGEIKAKHRKTLDGLVLGFVMISASQNLQCCIDQELFVATCSPARDPNSQSDFVVWGNSSLIGPFGEVLAAAGHEDATVIGEIDLSLIEAVRRQRKNLCRESLPLETQGRGDLYRLIDVQREHSS
uniref:Omega-amidase NIT2 n=1 Tax=Aegilops tauschii TaxID=37682 RepID=R7WC19_AEGTA